LPAELLETAARIFRAEAQDGYRDRVVIGGLFGFVDKLQQSVPDVNGVADLLHDYAALAPSERAERLSERGWQRDASLGSRDGTARWRRRGARRGRRYGLAARWHVQGTVSKHGQREAGREQVPRHRPAHDAEPDKTDLHDASPLLVRRWGSLLDCATVLQFRPRSQADRAAEPILARYLASRPAQ